MKPVAFPSQGDLLKFFYNATGLIPTKGEEILDISIKPKSLHKNLKRLAEEKECNFLEILIITVRKYSLHLHLLLWKKNLKKLL